MKLKYFNIKIIIILLLEYIIKNKFCLIINHISISFQFQELYLYIDKYK